MTRETTEQLQARIATAERLVPAGRFIRHVRTGVEYLVRGHALHVGDLALMVQYSPRFGPVIVFSRDVDGIRAKFVLTGGDEWPEISETKP